MELSSELSKLIGRFYSVFETGDMAVAREVLSGDERLLLAGTDSGEFGRGPGEVLRIMEEQSKQFRAAGMALVPGDAEAYAEGNVGWIWDRPRFRMPDGSEIQVRVTAVCRREDGAWRVVHVHASTEPGHQ
ncbi:MAG: nuclear transport factor 2 family protein [Dehalococcoidia bacterium]|nr:nuclear transport factor 2 family protein [Dehalococcoidia bacterium]